MSGLTRQQMYSRYKQQEDWAKEFLTHAQSIIDSSGSSLPERLEEVRLLIEHTLIAADEVMQLRGDIRQYYNSDPGHDQAINWVYVNIITPATQLGDRLNLQYNRHPRCRPSGVSHFHRIRRGIDGLFSSKGCEPARACFLNPGKKQHAFFFAGSGCVEIDVKPGTTDDTIVNKPTLIINQWPFLRPAGFFIVDAVLPNPANSNEAYFFSGDKYALVNINDRRIVQGPHVTTTRWPSLKSARFTMIDAVLPHPNNNGEAYFFSGNLYALIKINPGTSNDYIVNGPKQIMTEWPSLRSAGFDTVDAVLPNPNNQREAYFFSRENYALISIKPGTNDDKIVNGPKLVSEGWPSLREALFY
ncbi:hypothetical protein EG329_012035 [Mollisiaceae sp. DMI_Dod_QoI]|nr:hypothetical protein EG329_012035 [Helotiales sp. DMI_Dod_QoI]